MPKHTTNAKDLPPFSALLDRCAIKKAELCRTLGWPRMRLWRLEHGWHHRMPVRSLLELQATLADTMLDGAAVSLPQVVQAYMAQAAHYRSAAQAPTATPNTGGSQREGARDP